MDPTKWSRHGPNYLFYIVRVVLVLRLVVLAFVPHRWHIIVREAACTPLQGEAHSLTKQKR